MEFTRTRLENGRRAWRVEIIKPSLRVAVLVPDIPPSFKQVPKITKPEDNERVDSIILYDGDGNKCLTIKRGSLVGTRSFDRLLQCLPGVWSSSDLALHVKAVD